MFKIFVMATLLVASMASVPLAAGVGIIETDQTEYVYPSYIGTYKPGVAYVVCSGSDCSAPTPKIPVTRQSARRKPPTAEPMRIDPQKVMPSPAAVIPKPLIIRETLNFGHNSHRLSECDKQKLDAVKKAATAPGAKVTISGYTDNKGPKRYNDMLALRRAESARRYLGLGKEAVVVGKGKCCYLVDPQKAKNRRVELVIEGVKPQSPVNVETSQLKKSSIERDHQLKAPNADVNAPAPDRNVNLTIPAVKPQEPANAETRQIKEIRADSDYGDGGSDGKNKIAAEGDPESNKDNNVPEPDGDSEDY
jgi:outer membrane protein OmpA-like peptidoglycan-associated protein